MAVQFTNVADLKRQPTAKRRKLTGLGGFPQPIQGEMKLLPRRHKVAYPKPTLKKK